MSGPEESSGVPEKMSETGLNSTQGAVSPKFSHSAVIMSGYLHKVGKCFEIKNFRIRIKIEFLERKFSRKSLGRNDEL